MYFRFPLKEACDCDTLEKVLFRKCSLAEQGLRQKFRWASQDIGMDHFPFAARLNNRKTRWEELTKISKHTLN